MQSNIDDVGDSFEYRTPPIIDEEQDQIFVVCGSLNDEISKFAEVKETPI
jgi:hypothetical protein